MRKYGIYFVYMAEITSDLTQKIQRPPAEGLQGVSGRFPPGQHCWATRQWFHEQLKKIFITLLVKTSLNQELIELEVKESHKNLVLFQSKKIEIIHLFLVIPMYCQASSSQINKSLNLPCCQLAGKETQVHAVGSNSLEKTLYYLNFLNFLHCYT